MMMVVVVAAGLGAESAGAAETEPAQIRAAVKKALPLIEKSAGEYVRQKQCFSCHHQALPMLAMVTARKRGFEIDEKELAGQVKFTAESLGRSREAYREGRGQGGQATTAGYGLWALELGGRKGDETTSAVVEYLVGWQKELGHYRPQTKRPPSEGSEFTPTYVALRGMRSFGGAEQKERIAERMETIRRWVQETPGRDTEDRVFRLWALRLAGVEGEKLEAAKQELVETQRDDGGWAQTEEMESDAYATGSALFVLQEAGGVAVSDPVYQRGMAYLVRSQQTDGSWLVKTRSRPVQTYFESGFPHGKDQFISMMATSWATAALAAGCANESERAAGAAEVDHSGLEQRSPNARP